MLTSHCKRVGSGQRARARPGGRFAHLRAGRVNSVSSVPRTASSGAMMKKSPSALFDMLAEQDDSKRHRTERQSMDAMRLESGRRCDPRR